MPTLPEDEKKKKINNSPYMMTGNYPENKGFGISPVVRDAFSRRPDRSFTDPLASTLRPWPPCNRPYWCASWMLQM